MAHCAANVRILAHDLTRRRSIPESCKGLRIQPRLTAFVFVRAAERHAEPAGGSARAHRTETNFISRSGEGGRIDVGYGFAWVGGAGKSGDLPARSATGDGILVLRIRSPHRHSRTLSCRVCRISAAAINGAAARRRRLRPRRRRRHNNQCRRHVIYCLKAGCHFSLPNGHCLGGCLEALRRESLD